MARGVNKVILIGNIGKDPEIRYMPSGGAVANCSIATSETWKDKNTGDKVEKTEWHSLVFFGRLAEVVGEYVQKGSKIYVEGRLQTRKWQDKSGNDRYTTEIVANEMQMLDSRSAVANSCGSENINQGQASAQSSTSSSYRKDSGGSSAVKQASPEQDFDDDIPF